MEKLVTKYRLRLTVPAVLFVVTVLSVFVPTFIRGQSSDGMRVNDLLAVEKAIAEFVKQQDISRDNRSMPRTLDDLHARFLKGKAGYYSYSDTSINRFIYKYTICTTFVKEEKTANAGPAQPYSPHRSGENCFKVEAGVKGTSRLLVGDAGTY